VAADWPAFALLLLAAALHASWNALTKRSTEPLLAIWLVTLSGGLVAGASTPLVSFPAREAWPFLAGSLLLHLGYELFLAYAYRRGDLSQVYPVARGVAPCVVAALAALYAGEPLTAVRALGIALVAASIVSLSLGPGSRPSAPAVSAAVATGLLIGAYTYVDAQGVRLSRHPFDFIAWSLFLDALPITVVAVSLRARQLPTFLRTQLGYGVGGGVMATLAYATVLWAMSRTAMASVAAVRETSVIFAALIGTRLLREPFGARRTLASAGVVVGIALLTT
jgi:drug/metabolite transporter (DMT)-like permease